MKASRKSGVAGTIPFNNAAERALRGLALGRKSWLFCWFRARGRTRRLHVHAHRKPQSSTNVDPQAWLADVLARIADTPQTQISELLPWNWRPNPLHRAAA